jgi:hypothetical protein
MYLCTMTRRFKRLCLIFVNQSVGGIEFQNCGRMVFSMGLFSGWCGMMMTLGSVVDRLMLRSMVMNTSVWSVRVDVDGVKMVQMFSIVEDVLYGMEDWDPWDVLRSNYSSLRMSNAGDVPSAQSRLITLV